MFFGTRRSLAIALTLLLGTAASLASPRHASAQRPGDTIANASQDGSDASPIQPSRHSRYLIGLQRAEERPRAATAQGMVGLGDSVLTLHNPALTSTAVDVTLQKLGKPDIRLQQSLDPGGEWRLDFDAETDLEPGFYSVLIDPEAPLQAMARTRWHSGAVASLEAARSGRSLVLPLMMRDVYGHATVFRVMNPAMDGDPALMTVSVHHNQSGQQLSEVMAYIKPGETLLFDSIFESTFEDLPEVAGGGFVGSVRIDADQPLAVTAYGDEMSDDGASGYIGVPVEMADRSLFLPSVRANYLGDSLISLVNPSAEVPVQVTLHYAGTKAGGEEEIVAKQVVTIARMGTTIIDLARRQRGRPGPAELYGGRSDNSGFWGQVRLEATAPILAMVHEEVRDGSKVQAINAYNAFDAGSVGRSFLLPLGQRTQGGGDVQVVLQSTGQAADVSLRYQDGRGEVVTSAVRSVNRENHVVVLPGAEMGGEGMLAIESTASLAVLVHESSLRSVKDWGGVTSDNASYRLMPQVAPPAGSAPPTATRVPSATPLPTATALPATATPAPTATRAAPTPGAQETPRSVAGHALYMPAVMRGHILNAP